MNFKYVTPRYLKGKTCYKLSKGTKTIEACISNYSKASIFPSLNFRQNSDPLNYVEQIHEAPKTATIVSELCYIRKG